jgi:ribosomal protein L37AE/L43A
MELPPTGMSWAPRVPQAMIRRLYETDSQGIYDEELLAEVGWALRARCVSFVEAVEAVRGHAPCAVCGQIIEHRAEADEVLRCPACGWETTWAAYFKTIQHKQLSGADPVLAFFREFIEKFPAAATPREQMLLIDRLIHGFHYNGRFGATRGVCVNLIAGNYREVLDFLDRLTYGEAGTAGLRESRAAWRDTINQTAGMWHIEWLQREGE